MKDVQLNVWSMDITEIIVMDRNTKTTYRYRQGLFILFA